MVPFKAGAPYDSELIAELNQALQSSGYFEGVRWMRHRPPPGTM
jgi:translocation and assembly module TamA